MLGIYSYIDKQTNDIVYVGKDSNIDKEKRNKAHFHPSQYDKQPINRILQNNPNCYTYQVLAWNVTNQDTLNALETQYISHLKPKFNFTEGGDGMKGFHHSESTKKRLSGINKGKKLSEATKKKISEKNKGKNHPMYGKHHTEETKKILYEKNKGSVPWKKGKTNVYSEETLKKMSERRKGKPSPMEGKKHSEKTKEKISKSKLKSTYANTTGFLRVSKVKRDCLKQGFEWRYIYRENGKSKIINSVDLNKLKEKVLAKGLEWRVLND